MSKKILVIGTGCPTDVEFLRRKLLIEAGFELMVQDSTDIEIEGQSMELMVLEETSALGKETEEDNRPYHRKFEKRGKW